MKTEQVARELANSIGRNKVTTALEDLVCYSYDVSIYNHKPDIVVRAETKEDVINVMKIANRERIPVVPRGAATNNCGATVPINGGIVIDLVSMNKIREIDTENLIAVCEPGVILSDLKAEVAKVGLFYPPDPQGMDMCTIGGTIATDAGGPQAVKYGVTRNYVLGLETVLPTGELIKTGGKTMKDVSGYNLTQLLIGSEGTLGVFTEVTLRLLPMPEAKRTMMCVFNNLKDASVAVTRILNNKVIPSMLELLDKTSAQLIQKYMDVGYPTDAEAIVLIEVDGSKSEVDSQIIKVKEICCSCGAREIRLANTPEEAEAIWAGRKSGFAALAAYKPVVLPEDCTVPRNKLPEMMDKIQDIAKKYGVLIPTFGHVGDGNAHPHICYDPRNPDETESVKKIEDEIYMAALALGGTVSGEHGIGITKKRLMPLQHKESNLRLMAGIKKVFDPNNILNPGKAF
ncbi:MAG TPA: FAD-binding protein [Syntrophomonadaceae bacterium]|nr:FAD-binding protein [Syntrophomonadaceae bacterium]